MVLLPLIFIWYLATGNILMTVILASGISIAYVALGYAQMTVPLLKVDNEIVEVNNFFYTGRLTCTFDQLIDVAFSGKKVIFSLASKKIVVSLIGMPKEESTKRLEEIKRFMMTEVAPKI
tara:strand:+ start:824 stop:1183 length:360 start_codon:yes stop_codon:yes gene_type:complete